jgi:L-asparaginase
MKRDKVFVINTGGTIGMVHRERDNPLSPLRPAAEWKEIAGNYPVLEPEILGVETGYYQFSPLLDSSDIVYENWKQMADVIDQNYEDYAGFVVLHGTDTMCYTASALSFMLENLNKPVIITGSQIPMVRPRSDALQNLVTAIHIAAPRNFGYPVIPEVCIFFRDTLIRGNRARKLSSSGYAGFISPNYQLLAKAGEHIEFNKKFIHEPPKEGQEFYPSKILDARVMVLEIFPCFNPAILKDMFPESSGDRIKGLILKTFGAGNAPSNKEFLSAIEYVTKQGVIVVDVTQCAEGMVELGLYEASSGLLNRGVISGVDMTPEAAVCKLMYLLGKGWPRDEVIRKMQQDIRGEQSLNIYNIDFDQPAKANVVFREGRIVPGDIDFDKFKSASLRFQDAKFIEDQEKDIPLKIKVFLNHPNANETTPTDDPLNAGVIERSLKPEEKEGVDLFLDVSKPVKKIIRRGEMATISLVTEPGQGVQWKKMGLSIYTMTQ